MTMQMIYDDQISHCLGIGNMRIAENCLAKYFKAYEFELLDFNEFSMTNKKYQPQKRDISLTIFKSNITDNEID